MPTTPDGKRSIFGGRTRREVSAPSARTAAAAGLPHGAASQAGVPAQAGRTAEVLAHIPDVVAPAWLEAQRNPQSPAFTPTGGVGAVANVTGRDWTPIGTLDGPVPARCDRVGTITPAAGGASCEIWIRAPHGWVFPSRTPGVTQIALDATPVVSTAVPVGDGEVTTTVYGVAGDPAHVVCAVTNHTDAPVALAVCVRPFDTDGAVPIERIAQVDEHLVLVDGRPFLEFGDLVPQRVAMSTLAGGEVAHKLEALGSADHPVTGRGEPHVVHDPDGFAQAAFVLVLTHGTTTTLTLPLADEAPAKSSAPHRLPGADAVVRGWKAQTADAATVLLPDARATAALAQAPDWLLLADGVVRGNDAALVRRAGAALGCISHLGGRLAVLANAEAEPAAHADAATLISIADHWDATRNRARIKDLFATIEDGAFALAGTDGADVVWALAALDGVVRATHGAGADELAGTIAVHAATLRGRLVPDAWAAWPLAVVDAEVVGDDAALGVAGLRPDGLALREVLVHAGVRLLRGDPGWWDLVDSVLDVANAAWCWPELANPRSGGGCGGAGWDPVVQALLALLLRDALVFAVPPAVAGGPDADPDADEHATLELFSGLVDAWRGHEVKASHLPTPYGPIDVRLAWDGPTAIVQWRGVWGSRKPTLTAPRLAPDWSTRLEAGIVRIDAPPPASDPTAGPTSVAPPDTDD